MTHFTDWLPTNSCAAWIDLAGEVNLVNFYDHAEFFKDHPNMKDEYYEYRDDLDNNQQIINDDLASMEPDEHPAMHRFAGMDDESRDRLYMKAYNKGWLRLGVYARTYKRKASTYIIEVYGVSEFLNKVENAFRKLGLDLSGNVTFFTVVKSKTPYYKVDCVFSYERKKIC